MGKSAQFPLHVWLPDAMEGPTPVSALIHAATMVTAGVYLLVRTEFLFHQTPDVLALVAWIGGITALMAAILACVQTDIKRVLAYSTVSQLGYMMTAIGAGFASAGFLHLLTHGVFKALLFLGAGAVIHAVHSNEMSDMGGLFKKMPQVAIVFIIGTLSLAGVPLFAGFASKEEVLGATLAGGFMGPFLMLLTAAFLTAFYMFRVVFVVFFGPAKAHDGHAAHGPPKRTRTAPVAIPASPWPARSGSWPCRRSPSAATSRCTTPRASSHSPAGSLRSRSRVALSRHPHGLARPISARPSAPTRWLRPSVPSAAPPSRSSGSTTSSKAIYRGVAPRPRADHRLDRPLHRGRRPERDQRLDARWR